MKFQKLLFALILTSTLSACATYSSNFRVGNGMYYANLSDQRIALQTIQQLASIPSDAHILGTIDAGRCHRSFIETAPTEETVLLDLKVAAYALGAGAITQVSIEKQSALTKNCWHMLDGSATALRLSQNTQSPLPNTTSQIPSTETTLTDQQIRQILIRRSIASYSGSCACPYNTASNGSRCGGRSAYSRPGGASPLCYDSDITPQMIANYRAQNSN